MTVQIAEVVGLSTGEAAGGGGSKAGVKLEQGSPPRRCIFLVKCHAPEKRTHTRRERT